MIRGSVNAELEAVVSLEVLGPLEASVQIDLEVDTGLNGDLSLNRNLIGSLQLKRAGIRYGTLADGTSVLFDAYIATVDWHGAVRTVTVVESDGGNLLGMSLMKHSRLVIDVIESGMATIEPMRRP